MRRWALPLIALALIAGCGGDESTVATGSEGTNSGQIVFRRGNGGEPDTLDPQRNEENSGANVIRDLCEGLVSETVDAQLTPGVADNWEISPDGLTYTFHLRSSARWSNGDPVVAEDFVAGMRASMSTNTS